MDGWRLSLRARSPLLCGGVGAPPPGVHVSTAVVTPDDKSYALLPGSSVRGVLRDALRRFVRAYQGITCTTEPSCSCATCRLLGTRTYEGRLAIRSSTAPLVSLTTHGVAVDRNTGTAQRGADQEGGRLWSERRALASFEVDVNVVHPLDDADRTLLKTFWRWLETVGLSVGRRKSSGAGAFDVTVHPRQPTPLMVGPPDTNQAPRRYRITLTLIEPAHVVGPRQRDFYRDALPTIPASTLRGAIGRATEQYLGTATAAALFLSDHPVVVTSAFVYDPSLGTDVVPWTSLRRCLGSPFHLVDTAFDEVVSHLLRGTPAASRCPECDEPTRRYSGTRPPRLVTGHTAIDPNRRTALDGTLRHAVNLAPGTTFVAQLVATPAQADALAQLPAIVVGGQRHRGFGLAKLTVEEAPTRPPVQDRCENMVARLTERGASVDGLVAILGLATDAACSQPLSSLLQARGLVLLTGEVRTTLVGGWDELRRCRRSLREALAAGSWVAVRVPDGNALEALSTLETAPIPDPEEVAPLVVDVRSPWEEVRTVPDPATPTATSDDTDQLVTHIRQLCQTYSTTLPERSALQTLLRFAQGTPSVEELRLFIEYQATRFKKNRPFLDEVAQDVAKRYRSDIAGARRYLGILVRAGQVYRAGKGGSNP